MRFTAFVVVLSLGLVARTARADCAPRSMCVCRAASVAVDGRVLSVTENDAQLQVDAVEGDTSQVAVGSTITIARGGTQTGERWIATSDTSAEWFPQVKVKDDGHIDCIYLPKINLTAQEAIELSVASNCDALFEQRAKEQGLPEQGCNDSMVGFLPFGACHCSSGSAASLLALVPMLLRWRRRVARA